MTESEQTLISDPQTVQTLGLTRVKYVAKKLGEGFTQVRYGTGETIQGDGRLYGTERIRYGWFLSTPDAEMEKRVSGLCAVRLTAPNGLGFATREYVHDFTSFRTYQRFLERYKIVVTHEGDTEDLVVFLSSLPAKVQTYSWIVGNTPKIPQSKFRAI